MYECGCECGYKRTLYLGIGTLSEDRNTVIEMFDENIVRRFESSLASGSLKRWHTYNAPMVCGKCRSLFSAPVLVCEYDNGEKSEFASRCPECKNKCEKLDNLENAVCPGCVKVPIIRRVGHWS